MFRKQILTILAAVMLVGGCPAKADLVFDSGHNTFDDSYPFYDEVWVINHAVLDVLGGAMGKLELMDYARANIYAGDIDWLFIQDNTGLSLCLRCNLLSHRWA